LLASARASRLPTGPGARSRPARRRQTGPRPSARPPPSHNDSKLCSPPRHQHLAATCFTAWNLPDRAAVADATRGNDPDSGEAFEITGQARDAASEGTGEGVSVAAAVGRCRGRGRGGRSFPYLPGCGRWRRQDLRDAQRGRRRRGRGADVVIGFVECHGRQCTEECIDALEVVPPQDGRLPGKPPDGDGPRRGAAETAVGSSVPTT